MDKGAVRTIKAWRTVLWGLCLGALALGGCKAPPLLHNLQLWDEECQSQTDQRRLAPRLASLLSPETRRQRTALARQLHAPVPRTDLLALALDLHPERRAAIPAVTARAYAEGDLEHFWVVNPLQGGSRQLQARLLRVSDISYAWVAAETDSWDAYLTDLVTRFDAEVYQPAQWLYGFNNSPGFDQDPRIHLLFAPDLGQVLGYFNSSTGVSQAALPLSNEKELLFLNLDYMGNAERDLNVLAHELQHLIHWFHDPSERGFLNEGLSELAPLLLFAEVNPRLVNAITAYVYHPELQLNAWALGTETGLRHYGAGAAFALYLTETFGSRMLPQIVHEPLPGIGGLERLLADRGCDFGFDDLYADFVVANLVQMPQALGTAARLGYVALDQHLPGPVSTADFTPHAHFRDRLRVAGILPPYAVHYIDMAGAPPAETLSLSFQGAASVPFVTPEFAPPLLWSNRVNGSVVRLERTFDLTALPPGTEVWLETAMWWDIEQDWDYGYVVASRDGVDWDLLESPVTGTADPNGVALGPGLTGQPTDDAHASTMPRIAWDVSDYAGTVLHLRFDYVTDGAVTAPGWQIGHVAIAAVDFQEDFGGTLEDWHNAGWVPVQERLPVTWLVQAVRLGDQGTELLALERHVAAPDGSLQLTLPAPTDAEAVYLLVSPLAPLVTTPAEYEIRLTENPHS